MSEPSVDNEKTPIKRILIAYDGGAHGRRALALGAQFAHAIGARVDVVSVVPEGFDRIPDLREQPAIEHARELLEARDILRDRGIEPRLIEPAGNPAETIEQLVTERGYDAVILGRSRATEHGAPWTDSVSAHVAGNAPTTVIVAD
jgi:nucleotide-binding universal stress UspA family protein